MIKKQQLLLRTRYAQLESSWAQEKTFLQKDVAPSQLVIVVQKLSLRQFRNTKRAYGIDISALRKNLDEELSTKRELHGQLMMDSWHLPHPMYLQPQYQTCF